MIKGKKNKEPSNVVAPKEESTVLRGAWQVERQNF